MNGPDISDPLLETLRLAQRLGFFGAAPMESAVEHAAAYVDAIGTVPAGTRVVDIGSGGGLPGLVVARALPHVDVLLVDRRQKRTDFLERAVRRLDLARTSVRCADVTTLGDEVRTGVLSPFQVVTARGFGPPDVTLRLACRLLGADGVVVVSEPPSGDRWDPSLLDELELRSDRVGPVRRFHRAASR